MKSERLMRKSEVWKELMTVPVERNKRRVRSELNAAGACRGIRLGSQSFRFAQIVRSGP